MAALYLTSMYALGPFSRTYAEDTTYKNSQPKTVVDSEALWQSGCEIVWWWEVGDVKQELVKSSIAQSSCIYFIFEA